MPSSHDRAGPTDWDYELGPRPESSWAREWLMMGRNDVVDLLDQPMSESAGTQDWIVEPEAAQRPPRPPAAEPAAGRVRVRSARISKARPRLPRKNARVDLTRVLPRQGAMQMTHAIASGWLRSEGVRTKSTGNCTSKHIHRCTSLDSVRTGTIAGIMELRRESKCPIMVTGGTETGHAPGVYSHGNGYKLDISHNSCIDPYITKNYDKAGVRSDGAPLYRSDSGTLFADESSHWDILFR
ncbi:hypothetical protein [Nonomuraea helvata]|uniref:Peptidase M15A C-terminal domain-containing protein n=1 Tax=Nonomuraea helvata TaxID=37484 RepID=A0ABV5SK86_9ACTN